MEIKLTKHPKSPTIISGFPGFGMVGTIATEFLNEQLKTEKIGKILFEEMPALVAIHENKLVEPFGIFYSEKHNLVIIHALGGSPGTEWKIADAIMQIAHELGAKEIVSLEGVGGSEPTEKIQRFYYTTVNASAKKLDDQKVKPLSEGIILGVTSALLLKADHLPVTCLFAQAQQGLPDSHAAAEVIQSLDAYLNLSVDPKPLLEMAKNMEAKLQKILSQSKMSEKQRSQQQLSYMG
ncbi:proteasome assembly chaperone family protein [Candidatus Woesearchaeota archaeon]|nr:proteasome assembly chaperone family protein [Candidatus Woesearchaeota archaeon]